MDFGPRWIYTWCCLLENIVQIFTYNPTGELRQHLEIDAHVGGVNDIAFAHPNKQLCIVTCGDDKTIKEGSKSLVPWYIFSTAIDGKIKAWLYDCLELRVDYDAPGLWCTAMAYSADGTRANMMSWSQHSPINQQLTLIKHLNHRIVSSENVPTRIKKFLEEGALRVHFGKYAHLWKMI